MTIPGIAKNIKTTGIGLTRGMRPDSKPPSNTAKTMTQKT
jgi:hypothetical protein